MRVDAVEGDPPAVDLVEPHEQVDEGRLARPGSADDGDLLPGLRHKVDVRHERAVGIVAKAHVLKGDAARDRLRHMDGHLRIGLDLRLVEYAEDALYPPRVRSAAGLW